jgi:hypothetical protein
VSHCDTVLHSVTHVTLVTLYVTHIIVIDHQMCHRALLVTDVNKVWGERRVGKKWFQGLLRLLCSQPKAKSLIGIPCMRRVCPESEEEPNTICLLC